MIRLVISGTIECDTPEEFQYAKAHAETIDDLVIESEDGLTMTVSMEYETIASP